MTSQRVYDRSEVLTAIALYDLIVNHPRRGAIEAVLSEFYHVPARKLTVSITFDEGAVVVDEGIAEVAG